MELPWHTCAIVWIKIYKTYVEVGKYLATYRTNLFYMYIEVQVEQVWSCLGLELRAGAGTGPRGDCMVRTGGQGQGEGQQGPHTICDWPMASMAVVTSMRYPLPPMNRTTDIHNWKHYLATTLLVGGKNKIDEVGHWDSRSCQNVHRKTVLFKKN